MAKKKVKANGGALVYMVLDKSGSMSPQRTDTIAGCNRFIGETREADADARFSLIVFNESVKKVYSAQPISEVKPIDGLVYSPSGNTALNDAIGHAVKDIEDMAERPSKVVVAIFTDGWENASHEYGPEAVRATVAQHEAEDGWQFLFLAANLDAQAQAHSSGSSRAYNSVNLRQTSGGTQAAYVAASGSTSNYLRGMTSTADLSQDIYDAAADALDNQTTASSTIDQKVNARGAGHSTK